MKFLPAVAVAVIALAGATDAFAQYRTPQRGGGGGGSPVSLGARYRSWSGKLSGDIATDDGGLGTTIGLDTTLGLDDRERINDITGWLPGLPLIGQATVQYWWATFDGSRILGADETFAGTTFTAGSAVDTRSDWKVWTVLWESQVGGGPLPGLGLMSGMTGQFGLRYITLDTKIAGPSQTADAEFRAWIPVLGFSGRMSLAVVTLEGEVVGARAVGLGGVEGWIYDVSLSAQVRMASFFGGVGYRWFKLDVTDSSASGTDEISLNVGVEGLFFEAGFRF